MFANQHTNNPASRRYRVAERTYYRRSTLGSAALIEAAGQCWARANLAAIARRNAA